MEIIIIDRGNYLPIYYKKDGNKGKVYSFPDPVENMGSQIAKDI